MLLQVTDNFNVKSTNLVFKSKYISLSVSEKNESISCQCIQQCMVKHKANQGSLTEGSSEDPFCQSFIFRLLFPRKHAP